MGKTVKEKLKRGGSKRIRVGKGEPEEEKPAISNPVVSRPREVKRIGRVGSLQKVSLEYREASEKISQDRIEKRKRLTSLPSGLVKNEVDAMLRKEKKAYEQEMLLKGEVKSEDELISLLSPVLLGGHTWAFLFNHCADHDIPSTANAIVYLVTQHKLLLDLWKEISMWTYNTLMDQSGQKIALNLCEEVIYQCSMELFGPNIIWCSFQPFIKFRKSLGVIMGKDKEVKGHHWIRIAEGLKGLVDQFAKHIRGYLYTVAKYLYGYIATKCLRVLDHESRMRLLSLFLFGVVFRRLIEYPMVHGLLHVVARGDKVDGYYDSIVKEEAMEGKFSSKGGRSEETKRFVDQVNQIVPIPIREESGNSKVVMASRWMNMEPKRPIQVYIRDELDSNLKQMCVKAVEENVEAYTTPLSSAEHRIVEVCSTLLFYISADLDFSTLFSSEVVKPFLGVASDMYTQMSTTMEKSFIDYKPATSQLLPAVSLQEEALEGALTLDGGSQGDPSGLGKLASYLSSFHGKGGSICKQSGSSFLGCHVDAGEKQFRSFMACIRSIAHVGDKLDTMPTHLPLYEVRRIFQVRGEEMKKRVAMGKGTAFMEELQSEVKQRRQGHIQRYIERKSAEVARRKELMAGIKKHSKEGILWQNLRKQTLENDGLAKEMGLLKLRLSKMGRNRRELQVSDTREGVIDRADKTVNLVRKKVAKIRAIAQQYESLLVELEDQLVVACEVADLEIVGGTETAGMPSISEPKLVTQVEKKSRRRPESLAFKMKPKKK